MICCECKKDKPQKECNIKRSICFVCYRKLKYQENRSYNLERAKQTYQKIKNDPEYKKKKKEYDKKRTKEISGTPKYKIITSLRGRLRACIKNKNWVPESYLVMGCDLQTFRNYIESKFKPGMTWENYGPKGWHIDHIKPCCLFDLLDPEQQIECFNYTNLQPLWWHENIAKGIKYNEKSE